jgi:hypothetical protein
MVKDTILHKIIKSESYELN